MWRVMAAANCTKIKNHPNIMLIVVYQSIVLHPCLLSSFVFLVVVRCHCCRPSYSTLFVLIVVCHPPRLRRQGWRAIHPNIMLIVVFNSSSSVLIRCPLLSNPLLSSPLLSSLLLSAPLLSSASEFTITSSPYTPVTCIIPSCHQSIVPSIHCTIEPLCHTIMAIAQIETKPE